MIFVHPAILIALNAMEHYKATAQHAIQIYNIESSINLINAHACHTISKSTWMLFVNPAIKHAPNVQEQPNKSAPFAMGTSSENI